MPSIFQINTFCNTRSTGKIAESLGITAIKHGWKSYIAYGRDACPSQSQMVKFGSEWEVKWHGIETRLFDRHGLASKHATRKLIECVENVQPDIIHLHNLHGYYLNYPILFDFLKKTGKPVVWTLHDCWSFTGHCPYFEFVRCEKWKTGCYSCPNKKGYPGSFFLDRSKSNYNDKRSYFTKVENMTLVPVSDWLAEYLKVSFLKKYPIRRIHNGINLTTFKFNDKRQETCLKYGISEKKYIVLGVANVWDERKGLLDFFKLREILPNNYAIILVGLSKNQISNLPSGIVGVQRTDSINDLANLYSAANVFFNPTWEDNFPTVNIEAMACETPVVSYRTGGCVEQITDETGFLIDQGCVSDAAKMITEVCTSNHDYRNACRQHVETCFDQNDRFEEYYHLYQSLIS